VQRGRRRIRKVDRDHTKASRLQHKIERFQCAFYRAIEQALWPQAETCRPNSKLRPEPHALSPAHRVSTDPEQPIEVYSCSDDRREIKTIKGIDTGHNLSTLGGGGKHLQQQRGPSR
jgi:hypothetical protein